MTKHEYQQYCTELEQYTQKLYTKYCELEDKYNTLSQSLYHLTVDHDLAQSQCDMWKHILGKERKVRTSIPLPPHPPSSIRKNKKKKQLSHILKIIYVERGHVVIQYFNKKFNVYYDVKYNTFCTHDLTEILKDQRIRQYRFDTLIVYNVLSPYQKNESLIVDSHYEVWKRKKIASDIARVTFDEE